MDENYLKKKESGKVAEYYEKTKAKKKAQKEAKKQTNPNTYGIPVNEYKKALAGAE